MAPDVSAQIAELPGFSRQQLLDLWLELYGRAAPPGIRRELMVPFLAYRLQEKAYGGPPHRIAERRRKEMGLRSFFLQIPATFSLRNCGHLQPPRGERKSFPGDRFVRR